MLYTFILEQINFYINRQKHVLFQYKHKPTCNKRSPAYSRSVGLFGKLKEHSRKFLNNTAKKIIWLSLCGQHESISNLKKSWLYYSSLKIVKCHFYKAFIAFIVIKTYGFKISAELIIPLHLLVSFPTTMESNLTHHHQLKCSWENSPKL